MIVSFQSKDTKILFETGRHPRLGDVARSALRKLRILHATTQLDSLRIPAGNRLEALRGDKQGQYSIRVNDRWRICFVWANGNAHQVAIIDYH